MNVVIVRSHRKTLSLSVNRNAEVVVRVPLRIGEDEISGFIQHHKKWIKARLAEIENIKLNLSDGESISLFGKTYTLAGGKTALKDGTLFLPQDDRMNAFAAFLKQYAKMQMTERTIRLAKENTLSFSSVRISSARERWGSCNRKGGISYSFRVAFLPSEVVDYVVVHELCHTRHFNHSVQFWHEVEKILPDYEQRRTALREYGDFMNLL